ncbi:hypothetical protein WJX74_006551 [Apatococcus lobatus]|uniref:Uncharacterized protein n=1 Tax=Apatococcus lobatus TaxID=904363 RepID=A0AAW1RQR2_9CHLO
MLSISENQHRQVRQVVVQAVAGQTWQLLISSSPAVCTYVWSETRQWHIAIGTTLQQMMFLARVLCWPA